MLHLMMSLHLPSSILDLKDSQYLSLSYALNMPLLPMLLPRI